MMTMNQFNNALKALESVLNEVSKSIPYKASSDAPNTFKGVCEHFNKNGYFLIYDGSCDNTIFPNPETNVKFRAYHDAGHYKHNLSFKFDDEKKLGVIQADELRWYALTMGYDVSIANRVREIVLAEIVGQIEYFEMNGKYLDDQRSYTLSYLGVA